MSPRVRTLIATAALVACIAVLYAENALLSHEPFTLGAQIAAVLFMLWARFTFGMRSFNATAAPTAGSLVTHGPYAIVRNPIYASILVYFVASLIARPTWIHAGLLAVATIAVCVRVFAEERELRATYGAEYDAYAQRVKRLVPFVF